MKKLLYALIIPLLFISKVHALDNAYISNFYSIYDFWATLEDNQNYPSDVISTLVSMYNSNTDISVYPYYVIWKTGNDYINLTASDTSDIKYFEQNGNIFATLDTSFSFLPTYWYSPQNTSYGSSSQGSNLVSSLIFYSSNTDLHFKAWSSYYDGYSSLTLPSYSNVDLDVSIPQIDISNGDTIPTYLSLTNGIPQADFTEVNLSNYDYIILSLKNYNQTPFNTTIYTQGSLCFTPVYNYGMQQKNEVILGTQVQGCTEVYSSLTPVPIYIIESDITNHSVYYIKQQENVSTTLKIPTSIFDITYISSSETDPQVLIGGRSYPVIPYDDLTDTANISTDNGYISGQVCSLGDVNCQAPQNGMDISDLFTHPLELLKNLWSSITNVFLLITTFIGLLPTTLQAFLYTAFMLAIVLGIIKIIL